MIEKPINHITILIYAHPELYPPTLSSIEELSKITNKIDVLTRNTLVSQWVYPENVELHYINRKKYIGFNMENINFILKIYHFLKFVLMSKRLLRSNESQILLVYDVIPLYASSLFKRILRKNKTKLWYHNHDVTDLRKASKYSLMSIASRNEEAAIKAIDLFSLPSKERIIHFPTLDKSIRPEIIPNFPLKSFYSKFKKESRSDNSKIKLVYQGSIGKGHGLEDIIKILKNKINDKALELHLVGKIRAPYLKQLKELAIENEAQNQFWYHGMQPFAELPEFLSQFDIGLAIHKPYNVTYSTGGSASNKIYEYAAIGLPVLLYDTKHYRSYLDKTEWAFFTNLSFKSLDSNLKTMDSNWNKISNAAHFDFTSTNNFENGFKPILKLIHKKVE